MAINASTAAINFSFMEAPCLTRGKKPAGANDRLQ
jgi:hypothetical protein